MLLNSCTLFPRAQKLQYKQGSVFTVENSVLQVFLLLFLPPFVQPPLPSYKSPFADFLHLRVLILIRVDFIKQNLISFADFIRISKFDLIKFIYYFNDLI